MADPTFDADGNPTGGGFGGGSGIDPRSDAFQTAQTACGDLLQGVTLRRWSTRLTSAAIQTSLNDFTACLRDEGLQVDDITFGLAARTATAHRTARSRPAVAAASAVLRAVAAFPPAVPVALASIRPMRIIEQLGLDDTDPAGQRGARRMCSRS